MLHFIFIESKKSLTFVIKQAVLRKNEPAFLPQHKTFRTLFVQPPLHGYRGFRWPLRRRRPQLLAATVALFPFNIPELHLERRSGLYLRLTSGQLLLILHLHLLLLMVMQRRLMRHPYLGILLLQGVVVHPLSVLYVILQIFGFWTRILYVWLHMLVKLVGIHVGNDVFLLC